MNEKERDLAVEKTMTGWDRVSPAEVEPHFYAHLMVRLNQASPKKAVFALPHMLRWGVAALIVLTSLNVYSAWTYRKSLTGQNRQVHLQLFVQAYQLDGSALDAVSE